MTAESPTLSPLERARKHVRANDLARRAGIPVLRRATAAMVWRRGPRIVLNSVPKSGTHLVSRLLTLLPGLMETPRHVTIDGLLPADQVPPLVGTDPATMPVAQMAAELAAVRGGQFMTAHVPHHRWFADLVDSAGARHVLMLRDPRDLVVSHALFVGRHPRHYAYERYRDPSLSDEDRILMTIRGYPVDGAQRGSLDMGARLRGYLGWLGHTPTHVVRFEELIGSAGGGDDDLAFERTTALVNWLGLEIPPAAVRAALAQVRKPVTSTFRRAAAGGWVDHFTPAVQQAFDRHVGDVMEALGYG